MSGRLVLVATPIGNLGDLSTRAAQTLEEAALICCEDTRRTGRLLEGLMRQRPPLLRLDDHTESAAGPRVLAILDQGGLVALVTDAGTPGIADPGERIVRIALDAGHEVSMVPGPTAAVMALVLSGLPTARFCVEGFLPRSGAGRTARLAEIAAEKRTTVLYEAPHRVARTLVDLGAACGAQRRVAIARELTKLHEELWRGTLGEAIERTEEHEPRGEHVLVLAGADPPAEPSEETVDAALDELIAAGDGTKEAAAAVAARFGLARRAVYQRALARQAATQPG